MKINPNLAYGLAVALGALTVIGVVALDLFKIPDASFVGYAGSIVTVLVALAGNNAQNQNIETKVNGNLSKLIDAALANPVPGTTQVAEQVASESKITPTAPENGTNNG